MVTDKQAGVGKLFEWSKIYQSYVQYKFRGKVIQNHFHSSTS